MSWKTIESERLVDSRWVKVDCNKVLLPNGITIDDFYSITISEAAAIVALTEDGNIILKKEYRYTYDEELIEIPAGTFEVGETDGLSVAKRELLEETGYVSDSWEDLGSTIESSSKLTNHIHLYFAKNCKKVAEQKLDATEDLDVIIIPLAEAVDWVMSNKICCNSSAHAILKVARMI